jgi:hypothetical protein
MAVDRARRPRERFEAGLDGARLSGSPVGSTTGCSACNCARWTTRHDGCRSRTPAPGAGHAQRPIHNRIEPVGPGGRAAEPVRRCSTRRFVMVDEDRHGGGPGVGGQPGIIPSVVTPTTAAGRRRARGCESPLSFYVIRRRGPTARCCFLGRVVSDRGFDPRAARHWTSRSPAVVEVRQGDAVEAPRTPTRPRGGRRGPGRSPWRRSFPVEPRPSPGGRTRGRPALGGQRGPGRPRGHARPAAPRARPEVLEVDFAVTARPGREVHEPPRRMPTTPGRPARPRGRTPGAPRRPGGAAQAVLEVATTASALPLVAGQTSG